VLDNIGVVVYYIDRNLGGYMKLIIIASLLVFVGCKSKTPEQKAEQLRIETEFGLTCAYVGKDLTRCENHEVICYRGRGVETIAVSCNFKEQR
jgi:hypothetical protein